MLHEDSPHRNEKVKLHDKLRHDSVSALEKAKLRNLELDAFIVSRTPYDDLRNKWTRDNGAPWSRDDFTRAHILFPERDAKNNYIQAILF